MPPWIDRNSSWLRKLHGEQGIHGLKAAEADAMDLVTSHQQP
jgi:hypothetical protein